MPKYIYTATKSIHMSRHDGRWLCHVTGGHMTVDLCAALIAGVTTLWLERAPTYIEAERMCTGRSKHPPSIFTLIHYFLSISIATYSVGHR